MNNMVVGHMCKIKNSTSAIKSWKENVILSTSTSCQTTTNLPPTITTSIMGIQ